MNTKSTNRNNPKLIRKHLLGKLAELESLPGNWDEQGGAQVSPRASGQYKAFILDWIPDPLYKYEPKLMHDGSLKVEWSKPIHNVDAHFSMVFMANGLIALTFNGSSNVVDPHTEQDRVESFVHAAT